MFFELSGRKGILILGGIIVVSFLFGMLIGHVVTPDAPELTATSEEVIGLPLQEGKKGSKDPAKDEGKSTLVEVEPNQIESKYETKLEDKWEKEQDLIKKILERIDPMKIKENLKFLSAKPHMAATPRDNELAAHIRRRFNDAGFDYVSLLPSNFYLSKPDPNNPNKITMTENGKKIFESNHKELPIHPGDEDPNFVHAFNAFTPAGTVTTQPGVGVVYVNYGRIEDFDQLEELGVNISGHIALVRYGKIYRGNKIRHAEQAGATGVIIFSDPADVAVEGINPENVYDKTWWLPGSGMQRGSTYLGDGDPLTPGWPSTEHALRIAVEDAELHKIPAQPIGYSDAQQLLIRLHGKEAPPEWQGGLPGLTYKLGPYFTPKNANVSVTLSTHNSGKIERSYNVIGIIKGEVEPDRYVLVGNHRDAWGYGAADPSSGTAQLLETARVFGTLLKEGWRPRRSIVFLSWGAEEFGLIGSTEWVEEHVDKLQDRAVAYINTDTCASGPALHIAASPLMHDVFLNITKLIPGVVNPTKTIFDEWKEYGEALKPDAPEHPIISGLGSGSDHSHFSFFAGVPAADIWFRRDEVKHNITIYPFYHTGYETFYMVSTFVDPNFKIHQGCSRLAMLSVMYLADSSVIPYSLWRFPKMMAKMLSEFKDRDKLIEIYYKYVELENSVNKFGEAILEFEDRIMSTKTMSPLELRALNDQIMKLEQIFILPEGLPGRPTTRNAVFSPSQFDTYASAGFPGLGDLLYKYDDLEEAERSERDKKIKRHISDLTIMADRAASFLKDAFVI